MVSSDPGGIKLHQAIPNEGEPRTPLVRRSGHLRNSDQRSDNAKMRLPQLL